MPDLRHPFDEATTVLREVQAFLGEGETGAGAPAPERRAEPPRH